MQKVHKLLEDLLKEVKVRSITITGHSLGGALATVCAYDIGEWLAEAKKAGVIKPKDGMWPKANAVTWASPRVGVRPTTCLQLLSIALQWQHKGSGSSEVPDSIGANWANICSHCRTICSAAEWRPMVCRCCA